MRTLVVMSALIATLLVTPSAHAGKGVQDTDGWNKNVVRIDASRVNNGYWGIGKAVRQWNKVRPGSAPRLRLVGRNNPDVTVHAYSRSPRIARANDYPASGAGGFVYTRHNGRHVTTQDVYLNQRPPSGTTRKSRRFVTAHEFGHVMGLTDKEYRSSRRIMDGSSTGGKYNWHRYGGKVFKAERRALRHLY